MKILQGPTNESPNTRFAIEFDEFERNEYVRRFLEVFKAGLVEDELCELAYAIHCEIRHKHDLYIAVAERLEPRLRRALHEYAQCRGVWANRRVIPKVES